MESENEVKIMKVYVVYRDVVYGVYTTPKAAINVQRQAEKNRGLDGNPDTRVFIDTVELNENNA